MKNRYSVHAARCRSTLVSTFVLTLLAAVVVQPLFAADLKPGQFGPKASETLICYEGYEQLKKLADVTPAQDGYGNYHYMVVLFGYDQNTQTYPLDTLGHTANAAEFLSWYNTHWLSGDSIGDFTLRVYIHDDSYTLSGDDIVWQYIGELPYTVLPEFDPGAINLPDNSNPDFRDTVYLKDGKVYVSVTSRTLASGGSGRYNYFWLRGVKKIGYEPDLTDFKITTPGYVRLRREVRDSLGCGVAVSSGVYQLKVYPELIRGAIEVENTPGYDMRVYCSLSEAKADTVFATPATGGSGTLSYQWCLKSGDTRQPIPGATDCNLPLAQVLEGMNISQSQDFTVVRTVEDDTHFTQPEEAEGAQTIHVMQDFTSCIDGFVHQKFGIMLYVDNNSDNHAPVEGAKLHFKSYQWFKDCIAVDGQTGQYYYEDGQPLDGVYHVVMTADDGKQYLSCPMEIHNTPAAAPAAAPKALVYPVPVDAGELVQINCQGGDVKIYSSTGEVVNNLICPEQNVTVRAPRVTGIYSVHITHPDGTVQTEKLIVK